MLRWLVAGKTDKDIGGILGISPRTVHKHLQRIYEKLGVETRVCAVTVAPCAAAPVSEYVVVEVGLTEVEPAAGFVPMP